MNTRTKLMIVLALAVAAPMSACDSATVAEDGSASFQLEASETARERGIGGYDVTVVDESQTVVRILGQQEEDLGTVTVRLEQDGSHSIFEPTDGRPAVELRIAQDGVTYLTGDREIARFQRGEGGALAPVGELDTEGDDWPGFATLMAATLDEQLQGFLPSVVGFTWWTTSDDCPWNGLNDSCGACGAAYCGPLMYIFWPFMAPYCHSMCVTCSYCMYAAY